MRPKQTTNLLNSWLKTFLNPTDIIGWEKKGYFVAKKDENGYRKFTTEDSVMMARVIGLERLSLSSSDIKDAIEGNNPHIYEVIKTNMEITERVLFPLLREWLKTRGV